MRIGLFLFFEDLDAMFTVFIHTYFEATLVQTNFLNHILNRQPATESATGKKLASKSSFCEFCALIIEYSSVFRGSISSFEQVSYM